MNDNEKRKIFTQMADIFIDVANSKCEEQDKTMVASAFLYGAARFCAFVVAAEAGTEEKFDADHDSALRYFNNEFNRMFGEHLSDYKGVFTQK
ncbi:MAG: DUF3144 domain-containing protein [Gammaproteobacteria bacterium]|nr:DUF3144 domain-containing protein [Gammaproteobacteria bacterium]